MCKNRNNANVLNQLLFEKSVQHCYPLMLCNGDKLILWVTVLLEKNRFKHIFFSLVMKSYNFSFTKLWKNSLTDSSFELQNCYSNIQLLP